MTRAAVSIALFAILLLAGCDDWRSDPDPLVVTVTFPATSPYDTNEASITLTGTAVHGEHVDEVTWANAATGDVGTASGIHDWSAVVPLAAGDNLIAVIGHDSNRKDGYASVMVRYQPGFLLTPATLAFQAPAGGPDPDTQAVSLTYNGLGSASWTASSDVPWLRVAPAAGTIATETDALVVSVTVQQDESWIGDTSTLGAPTPRTGHVAAWTGSSMFVPWGAAETNFWNYVPDLWTGPFSSTGSCPARSRASAVWTGSSVIVWGGQEGSANVGTGYRYDPASNAWSWIASGGAPSARQGHSAVWTGTEMIVWGGEDGGDRMDDGGRYDPAANTWGKPVMTTGAPAARGGHAAVWTGTEMILWGGDDGTHVLDTGGRYDPAANVWTGVTKTAGAPAARGDVTAVWTGMEMIVWGGWNGSACFNSGARYDPAADVWRGATEYATAPAPRRGHTSVWTGSEMIVFGGYDGVSPLNDGARYRPPIDLAPGTYTGTVTVADTSGLYASKSVRVTLVVAP